MSTTVTLGVGEIRYALWIAYGRYTCQDGYTAPDGGKDPLLGDLMGTMSEIAVCKVVGADFKENVQTYEKRPGASPDLTLKGYKFSVKSTSYRGENLCMAVPEKDVNNDLYVLCCVDLKAGVVTVMGYATRQQLLRYEPEEWRWTKDRPGANKPQKKRRYVPAGNLTPFKGAK